MPRAFPAKVDLVCHTIDREFHCLVGRAPVKIVDKDDLNLLRHFIPLQDSRKLNLEATTKFLSRNRFVRNMDSAM